MIKNNINKIKCRVWLLDVWGNEKEGYDVNDRVECGKIILPLNCDDKTILKILKNNGFLNKKCHFKSFLIDGDENDLYIEHKNVPLYQLEII